MLVRNTLIMPQCTCMPVGIHLSLAHSKNTGGEPELIILIVTIT